MSRTFVCINCKKTLPDDPKNKLLIEPVVGIPESEDLSIRIEFQQANEKKNKFQPVEICRVCALDLFIRAGEVMKEYREEVKKRLGGGAFL